MAFTLTALQPATSGFIQNITGDLSGAEAILAAVTGKSIIVESLTIYTVDGETVTVGAGETTGAVTSVVTGPLDTGGTAVHITYPRGVKLATATALTVDSSGVGPNTVIAQGRVE